MQKLNNNLISIIDIGTAKVVCFIARVGADGELSILGIGHQVAQGIKSGVIMDVGLAEKSIRLAVGAAEQMAGVNIDKVIVNISGSRQHSHIVKAELTIQGDEISRRDISRIITQGYERYNTVSEDVIHCIPIDYCIDGTSGIKNPIGMYGNVLNASLHIITVDSLTILNLTNCLAQCHLNIEGCIASPYAAAVSCISDDEKELGVTVIDFGAGASSIAQFKEGKLVFFDVVPVGGSHVTNDIAVGLSTSIETAERIKTLHGNIFKTAKDDHEMLDIPQTSDEGVSEINNVSKSDLINIIRPRVEEIMEMIMKRLESRGAGVTGNIVITGGASQLRGLKQFITREFQKQVRLGTPEQMEGMAESTKGPAFSACVGMLKLAVEQRVNSDYNFNNKSLLYNSFLGKVVVWLKNNF